MKANPNIDKALEWLNQLESSKQKHDAEQAKVLKWLIHKAKLVEKMDNALAFYAAEKNHEWDVDDPWVSVTKSAVMKDNGATARKARRMSTYILQQFRKEQQL